jgi:hypothetical protein
VQVRTKFEALMVVIMAYCQTYAMSAKAESIRVAQSSNEGVLGGVQSKGGQGGSGSTHSKKRVVPQVMLKCLASMMNWQKDTTPYLCDLRGAPLLLIWWLLCKEQEDVLGGEQVASAAEALFDADSYGVVHHTVFGQTSAQTLSFKQYLGWLNHSSVALTENRSVLISLLNDYLSPEMRGGQAGFGVVDWMRSCVMVIMVCPHLNMWIEHVDTGNDTQPVRTWARWLVWDMAVVLGQMPINRGGGQASQQRGLSRRRNG